MTFLEPPVVAATQVRRMLGRGDDSFEVVIESLELPATAGIAIVGPSGSGKSTFLALLALALRPDSVAKFAYTAPETRGVDAAELWAARRYDALARLRSKMVGFVPQTGGLLPFLTLRANIALAQKLRGFADVDRIGQLAAALEIDAVLDRLPSRVSVGQRQRAAVVRALAHGPPLVLADEPTAAVHPAQANKVMELLAETTRQGNAALVVATHDIALAKATGLRLVKVVPGQTFSVLNGFS